MKKVSGYRLAVRFFGYCLTLLAVLAGGLLLLRYASSLRSQGEPGDALATLLSSKTAYVGNNSKVANLINQLPLASYRKTIALQTRRPPYGITVDYDLRRMKVIGSHTKTILYKNAVILFALIANVDEITFRVRERVKQDEYTYLRSEVQQGFGDDLRDYSKDRDTLAVLNQSLGVQIEVFPANYSPLLSSMTGLLGFRVCAKAPGNCAKVRYTAGNGDKISTWNLRTGRISEAVRVQVVAKETPVYWMPYKQNQTVLGVALLDRQNRVIAKRQLIAVCDRKLYYTVNSAVGVRILSRSPDVPPQ